MGISRTNKVVKYQRWASTALVRNSAILRTSESIAELRTKKSCGTVIADLQNWTSAFPQFSVIVEIFNLSVCLSVCLPICLSDWLSVRLSVWMSALSICLSACLSVCPSAYLSVGLPVCLSTCLSVWLHVCLPAYLSFRLSVCLPLCRLPVCRSACLPLCLSTCPPLCLSTCPSTCLSVYVCSPACLLVCVLVCQPACRFACLSFCLPACLSICLPVCLSACLPPTCPLPSCLLHACLPACLFACLSACLHELIDDCRIKNHAHILILQIHDCGIAVADQHSLKRFRIAIADFKKSCAFSPLSNIQPESQAVMHIDINGNLSNTDTPITFVPAYLD